MDEREGYRSRRLFIGNLTDRVRPRHLDELFSHYGKVTSCDVKNGYGFVEFDDPACAAEAKSRLNGYELDRQNILVDFARSRKYNVPSDDGSMDYRDRPPPRGPPPRRYEELGGRTRFRLVVKNCPPALRWQELKEFMRRKAGGEITYANVYRAAGQPPTGVVEYSNREDMVAALRAVDSAVLDGQTLHVFEDADGAYRNGLPEQPRGNPQPSDQSRALSPRTHSPARNPSSAPVPTGSSQPPAPASSSSSSSSGNRSVYVGNLPPFEIDLAWIFNHYGPVRNVDLKQGYAFVEFENAEDAADAIESMKGYKYQDHVLNVQMSARGSGGGRGRAPDSRPPPYYREPPPPRRPLPPPRDYPPPSDYRGLPPRHYDDYPPRGGERMPPYRRERYSPPRGGYRRPRSPSAGGPPPRGDYYPRGGRGAPPDFDRDKRSRQSSRSRSPPPPQPNFDGPSAQAPPPPPGNGQAPAPPAEQSTTPTPAPTTADQTPPQPQQPLQAPMEAAEAPGQQDVESPPPASEQQPQPAEPSVAVPTPQPQAPLSPPSPTPGTSGAPEEPRSQSPVPEVNSQSPPPPGTDA